MKYFRILGLIAIILFSGAFPILIGDANSNSIAVNVLLLTGAAVAWNLFSGYTGYISLGHATYYGLGAYILTLACQGWHIQGGYEPFLLVPLAGVVAGVFSIPLGWIALRTRQYTFMVLTIAIFFIFQLLAYNLSNITGGSNGIFLPLPTWSSDLYNTPFYYVALALLLLAILVSWWVRNSKYGLILLAIRDDEDRVRGLGIQIGWYKLGAYVLSAVFTGMIGALAIYFAGLITPSSAFDQTLDITIVTITFLGGIGSVIGPIVGGLLLEPLQTYLNQQLGSSAAGVNQVLFGCFLLVVILLLPEGIVPSLHKRWQVWRASRNKINATGTVLPTFKYSLDGSSEQAGALASQEIVQTLPAKRHTSQVIPAIPHRHTEQLEPLLELMSFSQKLRAQRLVPIMRNDALPMPGKMTDPSLVSWRCPHCKIPFLLNGNTCYCRRCGFTRPLTDGMQSVSTLTFPSQTE